MEAWEARVRGEVRLGGLSRLGHASYPYSPLRKVPCLSTELGTLPGHRMAHTVSGLAMPGSGCRL